MPTLGSCARCGNPIGERLEAKRRRRYNTKLCSACKKRRGSDFGRMVVLLLAERDGAWCGICGSEIDMTLTAPDLMRPSIDHIVPRANGGADVPSNIQLAHLLCNVTEKDKG